MKRDRGISNPLEWNRIDYLLSFILIVVSSLLLFLSLDKKEVLLYDEAVYSRHDILIYNSGSSVFFPDSHIISKEYFRKFPLKSWLKDKVIECMDLSVFSLRFLDALMGLFTVVILFLLGRYLFNRWIGALASMILLTTKAFYLDWTQTNQYDAGFILGSLAFLYLFITRFDKKWGWLFCGLALAFTMYFKHIQSIITLSIAVIYLMANKKLRELLSLRFIGMCLTACVLLLVWLVPFAVQHPDFLKTFSSDEVNKRIFEGYFTPANDLFFYIKSLSLLGNWLFILPFAVIYSVYLTIKKQDKRMMFILLWVLMPLVLLTVARSKLDRYAYICYPALALIVAASLFTFYRWALNRKIFAGRTLFKYGILIFFGIFLSLQVASAYHMNSSVKVPAFHILTDFYTGKADGVLTIMNLKENDFHLPEWIEVNCIDKKTVSSETFKEALNKMGEDDTLIVSRSRLLNALSQGLERKIDITSLRFFNYSSRYTFTVTNPKVKVGLIKNGSKVAEKLMQNGIELYPASGFFELPFKNVSNVDEFVQKASERILGYSLRKNVNKYYAGLIEKGELSRDKFEKILLSYAVNQDYHYLIFNNNKKLPVEVLSDETK